MLKKLIITVIVIAIIVGGGYFGIKAYRKHRQNSDPVNVYAVAEIASSASYYEENYTSMSGNVSSGGDQKIYISSDKTVSEVLVEEGDKVKSGDVLFKYDATQEQLKLESLYADLEVTSTDLKLANAELTKLNNTTPVPDTEEPTTESSTELPEIHSTNDAIGELEDEEEEEEEEEEYEEGDEEDEEEEEEEEYTQKELEAAITKKKNEIKNLENEIDTKNLSIRKQQAVIDKCTVCAKVNGIVVTLDMSDEKSNSGEPNLVVSTSGTFIATVNVGELELKKMKVGTEVSVYCYDTGNRYTGEVMTVGISPNSETTYPYAQSYYPVKISIEDSEGLDDGAYVEVTLNDGSSPDSADSEEVAEEEEDDSMVIPLFLTKQENGKYYVYKRVNGRLKKQFLKTGKIYWGSEIIVKGGITMDDYVAFPYDKNATDGKVCKEADSENLYQ